MKQLSVIIVNYNVRHFLELCLDSVYAALNNLEAEVIVVDNLSTDGSCEMVRTKFPEVRLIANKENVGFSKANNQGFEIAQGEYVCILNPDTVVGEQVFDEVYAFAKASSDAGTIGVRLIDGTSKYLPESKRNLPVPKVAFNKLFGNGNAYYATQVKESGSGQVPVLVGAFMFMSKDVYEEVGGFDERYFMYGEDIDLSYSIESLGYRNFYLGEQIVVHFKGESTAKDQVYRRRFYDAMQLFYDKHFKASFVQNLFIKIGLQLAKLSSSKPTSKDVKPAKKVLISKDPLLVNKLTFGQDEHLEFTESMDIITQGSEIWYDANTLTYADIINHMIRLGPVNIYKFIPKNSTFAIGSNSSEGRGEVVEIE